jgi:hypothetical protein
MIKDKYRRKDPVSIATWVLVILVLVLLAANIYVHSYLEV